MIDMVEVRKQFESIGDNYKCTHSKLFDSRILMEKMNVDDIIEFPIQLRGSAHTIAKRLKIKVVCRTIEGKFFVMRKS